VALSTNISFHCSRNLWDHWFVFVCRGCDAKLKSQIREGLEPGISLSDYPALYQLSYPAG